MVHQSRNRLRRFQQSYAYRFRRNPAERWNACLADQDRVQLSVRRPSCGCILMGIIRDVRRIAEGWKRRLLDTSASCQTVDWRQHSEPRRRAWHYMSGLGRLSSRTRQRRPAGPSWPPGSRADDEVFAIVAVLVSVSESRWAMISGHAAPERPSAAIRSFSAFALAQGSCKTRHREMPVAHVRDYRLAIIPWVLQSGFLGGAGDGRGRRPYRKLLLRPVEPGVRRQH